MAKLKTFLDWVGKKRWRWLIVLISAVVLIISIFFGVFMLMSGYDKKQGFHKDPVKIDVNVNKGEK